MNPLRTLENMLAGLVEGTFGRVFKAEVRPMELARKLAREMDENKTASVSRVYAPNEYSIWLSPRDRARWQGSGGGVVPKQGQVRWATASAGSVRIADSSRARYATTAEGSSPGRRSSGGAMSRV